MEGTNFSDKKLQYFLKKYPGCLFMKDENGCYIYCNELCQHINQWDESGIYGKNELEVQKNPILGRQYYEEDMKLLKEEGFYQYRSEFKNADESTFFEIHKASVTDDTGKIIGIIGSVIDVTEESKTKQALQKMFVTDTLTGIYNVRYLEQWLTADNIKYPFTLIACDCNFLKYINDTYGHEYGDFLLKNVGELFTTNLPAKCSPVRIGGDEFLILCNNTTEKEASHIIADLKTLQQHRVIKGNQLSIAYGSCTIYDQTTTFETCRNTADERMYAEKKKMKEDYFGKISKNEPLYSEFMFQKLIGQMPIVVFFKDTECKYQYISSYDERNLKNKKDTHYGLGLTDLELQKNETLGRQYYEDDLRILATGEGSILISKIPIDNDVRYYQITKSAVHDEENRIIGISGVVMDVTATKIANFNGLVKNL